MRPDGQLLTFHFSLLTFNFPYGGWGLSATAIRHCNLLWITQQVIFNLRDSLIQVLSQSTIGIIGIVIARIGSINEVKTAFIGQLFGNGIRHLGASVTVIPESEIVYESIALGISRH